jgi:GNAT superfamily N-acetyltransferase
MSPVIAVSDVFDAIQRAKAAASAFCTNFFPTQGRLQGWIDHGELLGEVRDRSAFFLRSDRGFWHLYFCAADRLTLQRELGALPEVNGVRVTTDLLGSGAGVGELVALVKSAGFRHYARLVRLARASSPGQPHVSPNGTEVVWADKADCQGIVDLLECSFDAYADQLPMPYEIEAAIAARQILTVRCEGMVAALLFFETQGFTSTIRYWVVAERFRSHRFGSALMRQYLATQSAVRRFILWVTASNDDAVQKYRHYGYAPDGLVDEVLVNQMIRS